MLLAPVATWAATFTVTSNLDSGAGTLRQAILDSNAASPGPNIINFNISGAGNHTISPLSSLPAITVQVTIGGYTQPGASANSGAFGAADNAVIDISIDGGLAPAATDGLSLQNHTGSQIVGLNIRNFSGNGVVLGGTGGGHTIAGCFIGTDEVGGAAAGNSAFGVLVGNANNTVGGTTAAARNIISGNGQSNVFAGVEITGTGATGNVVLGNYIGTSASGTVAIGNSVTFGYGVLIVDGASNNTIGSSTAPGNVISGNGGALSIQGGVNTCSNNTVAGNLIGTNAAGTAALGNSYGIGTIAYANNTTIGGLTGGATNVISGNGNWGIIVGGSNSGHTFIWNNRIGTNATGTGAVPNTGHGIFVEDSGAGNTVMIGTGGVGNEIAYNTGSGVNLKVGFGAPVGDGINGNSIHDNGALGIDLNNDGVTPNDACDPDTGPNNLQNFPVLSAVTSGPGFVHIVGSLNSTASTTFGLEFFSNPSCDPSGYGEGRAFLGFTNVTTDGSCNATIDVTFPVAVSVGAVVTATATDPANNTSEFSACVAAAAGTLASSTAVVSSLNPSSFGQLVTFTATVTGGGPTPTGSVSFYDGLTLLGTVALGGGGTAALSTSSLAVGTHQITAQYGGDGNYGASTSPVLTQVVNAPAPAEAIPVLGAKGLALLALLVAAAGVLALRRSLAG